MNMILVLMAACYFWGGPFAGIGLRVLFFLFMIKALFALPGLLRHGFGRQRHI